MREVWTLAAEQYGLVARFQLVELKVYDATIRRRLAAGRWHATPYPGTYWVGWPAAGPLPLARAATLACHPGGALCGNSALALYEVLGYWPGVPEIVAPGEHRHDTLRARRCRTLGPADVIVYRGIPVVRAWRAVLEVAPTYEPERLQRIIDALRLKDLLDAEELLRRAAGRPGAAKLREIVDPHRNPMRSVFEQRFLAFCRRYGLPVPEVNVHVAGFEVDVYWRAAQLVVELDGRRYHEHGFEADRIRSNALTAASQRHLRITWRTLVEQPDELARTLRRLLDLP
jgi:hypothetical protein